MWQKAGEGTLGTARVVGTAIILADVDDERVEFVKKLVIAGKRRLKEFADFFIRDLGVREAVALENAASVGIDYKNGMFACVEKDGVSGFRADSVKVEELIAEDRGRR